MVLFSIVLSFFCVLIFYCFNKRISVSPKPGMVYRERVEGIVSSLTDHLLSYLLHFPADQVLITFIELVVYCGQEK